MFSTGSARIAELERMIAQVVGELAAVRVQLADLAARVERGSTAAIRADLDNLTGRLEQLATSNRKEFGRLHAAQRKEPPNGALHGPDGDELAETLAFQEQWRS